MGLYLPKSEFIRRLDGGLNTEDPVTALGKNEAVECDNVVVMGKTIGTRLGHTLHRDFSAAARVHSVYEFVKISTGDRFQIAGVGTDLYSGTSKIATGLSGNPLSFDVLNNALLICDGTNKLKVWTGTGSATEIAASPVCQSIAVINSCVVAFGISGAKNTYMWSDVQDYTSWPVSRQDTLIDNDPAGLVGGMKAFNQLGIWKKEKVYLVDGFPLPTNTLGLPGKNGCVSIRTLKESPQGPIWLSSDGVYGLFEGVITKLSEKINPLFQSINPARTQYAHAEVHGDYYYLAFSTGSNAFENQVAVLNLKTGGWTTWNNQNSAALGTYNDTNGVRQLYRGTADGKILLANYSGSDLGSSYRSFWRTPPIRFDREVTLFELALTVANLGTWPLQITYTLDQGRYASPVLTVTPSGGSGFFDLSTFDTATFSELGSTTLRKRIGGVCREVSFQIATDGPDQPWRLFELEVQYIPGAN